MYYGVIDFYKTLFDSLKTEPISMEMAYMYRSILIAKVQRIFRWYIYDNDRLKYLAISPKPLGKHICNVIRMNTKELADCNSFEGIGELRLAEKIVEAYEKFPKNTGPLKVALIGDINHPFGELKAYVEEKIGKSEKKDKIEYKIYTKNKGLENRLKDNCELNNVTIDNNIYDEILKSTKVMDMVLNKNHVVFFLDCVGLYEELSVYDEKAIESSMQVYRVNSYNAYSNWADDPQNIFASNPLDNLYQSIVAYMATGRFGNLEKNPKKQVLEYVESKIKGLKENKFKLVYVYVSDLKAFSNIYCREQYYMRVEQYNEKKLELSAFRH